MDDREREHPDEGTIHAWLDGALDDGAARALAAHVAGCPACAERVAEARGLIAGASRIIGALDDVPSGTAPAWGRAPAAAPVPAAAPSRGRRLLRVTPARAAIAATVLVALGVSLTYERTAVEPPAGLARSEVATAPAKPQPRDALLDSAVARNVAAAQPPRAVHAAPGADVPVPAAPPAPNVMADAEAPARVAAARATLREQRESAAGTAADQLQARTAQAARAAEQRTVAAAVHADSVTFAPAGVVQGRVLSVVAAAECYRVESANGIAATWGADSLPLVVRVDSARRTAAVLSVAGQGTGTSAVVTPAGSDSLLLRLRRLGYEGTLALGAAGDARAGVMRSRPSETVLGQVVTTAVAPEPAPSAGVRRSAPAAKAAAPPPAARAEAQSAAPAVPVVARRIRCP